MGAQPRPWDDRRAMQAKVHIARKEMALDEGTYRALVLRITSRESTASATNAELGALLAEMKRLGWTPRTGKRHSHLPNVRMIHAIWADMRPLLKDGSDQALRGFVARQTKSPKNPAGVGSPEWLKGAEANKVIEGLKAWRSRLMQAQAKEKCNE
jgi:phage gp16-like protein